MLAIINKVEKSMYAIDCVLEQGASGRGEPETCCKAFAEAKKILGDNGFTVQKGSVFEGHGDIDEINAYRCIIALTELTKKYPFLSETLKTVRILKTS